MKPSLFIVKKHLNNPEEESILRSIYQNLENHYNIGVVILERREYSNMRGIAIIGAQMMIELHGTGLALDVEAAKAMERAPMSQKYFLNTEDTRGVTKVREIFNLDLLLGNTDEKLNTAQTRLLSETIL